MRFASSITATAEVEQAIDELLAPIDQRVTPGMVDLALLFITPHHVDELPTVIERVNSFFPAAVTLGCTAEGAVGHDRELERMPAMALLAASLPDVQVRPFRIKQADLESKTKREDWELLTGVSPESRSTFIAFADPFRFAVLAFVEKINEMFPGSPLVGGISSGAEEPGQNRLICQGEILKEGVVGVSLTAALEVDTVVSQGCRPVGKPFVITKGERNVIVHLGGRPALERLQEVLTSLPPEDERLARQSLFVGRVINEYKSDFTRGDFLTHNIIGFDRGSGALAIAGLARVGATVQFHVRDADSADEDLRFLLAPHANTGVKGAMLFGCNGRGTRMWPDPGHEIGVLRRQLGDIPAAGFFCGGEFGPIGGRNFVHGFTASIALFREAKHP